MSPPMASPSESDAAPIADIPLSPRFGWGWKIALGLCGLLVLALAYAIVSLVIWGVGLWGVNIPFVWGFDLINYVWWIGIANGASLVAATLVLRRNDLRTAVNRFAEGAALFAVICAGIFPIIHLGKPWLFYWTFPFPATFEVWPQFRSTLTWDFWAISTHFIVTTLLWYTGLIPDLATLRDRAERPFVKRLCGVFALGWRGSVRHWTIHQSSYRIIAITMLPVLVVMQSVVSFEFAVTLVPDWHETRQPLHFLVTGIESGLATFLLIAVLLQRFLQLERYIEPRDTDLIAVLLAANALFAGYVYLDEVVVTVLDTEAAWEALVSRMTGPYAGLFWSAIALAVGLPQLLWFRRLRRSAAAMILVALGVYVGVWLDRFSIVVAGLLRTRLPYGDDLYWPTFPEWLLFFGTIGLFAGLLLLFVRYLPVVSLYEARHDERQEAGS